VNSEIEGMLTIARDGKLRAYRIQKGTSLEDSLDALDAAGFDPQRSPAPTVQRAIVAIAAGRGRKQVHPSGGWGGIGSSR
jgi:hypothetical protein